MISSEVQRTLVKSPPELWAELSDQASLARHLGELGEIRITRVEPERSVEWEAADTTGKVLLKQSGWGTKVTLTAAREVAAPEPPVELELEPAIEVEPEPEPVAVEEPEPAAILEEPLAAELIAESLPEPEPRRGFFARLFGRRKEQAPPQPQVEPETVSEPEPPEAIEITEPDLALEDEAPPQDAPADETPDIAAELKAAEEIAADEVTAVLTAVLDRLGAAHHRPFSRA
jgi:hypothetical protein